MTGHETVLESELKCPECGRREVLPMPTDACVYYHQCAGCGVLIKPRAGDCCVFCSYGTVPCPPVQQGQCCAGEQ
jgi:hypothetical protein